MVARKRKGRVNTKIGVLGTGMVRQAIAARLAELGHDVTMGARESGNEKAAAWARKAGGAAGTFADAGAGADVVFNCTKGTASLAALRAAGAQAWHGTTLADVANPLLHGDEGTALAVCSTDSLAEQISAPFPARGWSRPSTP